MTAPRKFRMLTISEAYAEYCANATPEERAAEDAIVNDLAGCDIEVEIIHQYKRVERRK